MIGESIGSYRIVSKLGEGGMGAVYLGEHQRIARKAAIKVLLPQLSANQQIVARFFNEARATSLIRHPGIVEILDCDILPSGSAFIVMEYLVGETLGDSLRRGERLDARRAAFLTRHIADALAAAHDSHIVHRDLKPDNIFLPAAGAQPIKILDFGIAKLMHTSAKEGSYKTNTGSLIGTPVYMSPEQCRGTGEIDLRTDIYSLGCMVFEMLCGHPPFTSDGFGELIHSHMSIAPPTLRSIDPSVPRAFDELVARMLAKAPARRPQTMQALIVELDALIAAGPAMPAATARASRPVPTAPMMAANQTTLRSASSEKVDDLEALIARPRRAGRWIAVAALAIVVGGVALWRADVPSRPNEPERHAANTTAATNNPAPAATPPTPPTPMPPDTKPSPPPASTAAPDPVAAPAPARTRSKISSRSHTPRPTPVKSVATVPPAAARVKISITSEPSGAEVCLASDRTVMGRTDFDWMAQKGAPSARLLIRKRGYRGQDITVATDRDTTKQITLRKLGPDDIDDIENCRR